MLSVSLILYSLCHRALDRDDRLQGVPFEHQATVMKRVRALPRRRNRHSMPHIIRMTSSSSIYVYRPRVPTVS